MLDSCEKEEKKIEESLALLERNSSLAQEGESDFSGLFSSLLEEISQEKEISTDLLGKFIDKIEVFQSREGFQTIRIYYKVLAPTEEGNGLA